jgi:hypothetical protein
MAGFEVILYGRFWVIAEAAGPALTLSDIARQMETMHGTQPVRSPDRSVLGAWTDVNPE